MSVTDSIERIEARHAIRRKRRDRIANLAAQPKWVTRAPGQPAPKTMPIPIPQEGTVRRGRPLKVTTPRTNA